VRAIVPSLDLAHVPRQRGPADEAGTRHLSGATRARMSPAPKAHVPCDQIAEGVLPMAAGRAFPSCHLVHQFAQRRAVWSAADGSLVVCSTNVLEKSPQVRF
jgi:hypothetical protein